MNENQQTALLTGQSAETAEEIIGVLTAISVVSKRMAAKLALLEQRRSMRKDGEKPDARGKPQSAHAD